jgi:hypothetical protein
MNLKHLLLPAFAFFCMAQAAPSYTRAQVAAICSDAPPVPNPGWQDYFGFMQDGRLTNQGGHWQVHGVMLKEKGLCVFGAGQSKAEFRLDDPVGARRRVKAEQALTSFDIQCMREGDRLAAVVDKSKFGAIQKTAFGYQSVGTVAGKSMICQGQPWFVQVDSYRSGRLPRLRARPPISDFGMDETEFCQTYGCELAQPSGSETSVLAMQDLEASELYSSVHPGSGLALDTSLEMGVGVDENKRIKAALLFVKSAGLTLTAATRGRLMTCIGGTGPQFGPLSLSGKWKLQCVQPQGRLTVLLQRHR